MGTNTKPAKRKPGRPKGSLGKRNVAIRRAVQAGMTPLEFFIETYTDEEKEFHVRLDAAKAAAPYCHQRLAALEVTGDLNIRDRQKETAAIYNEVLDDSEED